MSREPRWFIIIAVVAVLTFGYKAHSQTAAAYSDEEAFRIYSAIMPGLIAGKAMLVEDTTAKRPGNCLKDESVSDPDLREALADYHHVNEHIWILSGEFDKGSKRDFVQRTELDSFFRKSVGKGWEKFYRKHPHAAGFVSFSAVGFNKDRSAAVVYSAATSCAFCASGGLHFMKKGPKGWVELKDAPTCRWISGSVLTKR
jgi:hypothetical protein